MSKRQTEKKLLEEANQRIIKLKEEIDKTILEKEELEIKNSLYFGLSSYHVIKNKEKYVLLEKETESQMKILEEKLVNLKIELNDTEQESKILEKWATQ